MNQKIEKMIHYFACVPQGTAYQSQLDLQKLFGFRKEYAKQSIQDFARRYNLKAEPHGDGMWKFTRELG